MNDEINNDRLTVGEVARLLSCSTAWVAQLDAVLLPEKVGARGIRIYEKARVVALAAERDAARRARASR